MKYDILSHENILGFMSILEDKARSGVLNTKDELMMRFLWNADQFLARAVTAERELLELRRAVISLHDLIKQGGDYAISRSDKTPMLLSDGIIIQDVLATIYKLLPEPPEEE